MLGLAAVVLASPVNAEDPSAAEASTNSQAAAVAAPSPPPTCSSIPVELLDDLNSGTVKTGDHFKFRALETVVTGDKTTIHAGTIGLGLLEYVTPAGAHGHPGGFLLEARYFMLPHGREFQVTVDALATNEMHSGSTRNAPGIANAVPLPFIGLVVGAFNFLHAGANVDVPPGYRFAVTPVGDLGNDTRCVPEFQI